MNAERIFRAIRRWIDSTVSAAEAEADPRGIDWPRIVPFVLLHLACLSVIWVGWTPVAVWVAAGLFAVRMFAITAFYHRYFSHRAYRASRPAQFVFAVLGASAVQRGPLWWAAHHRHHHLHADRPEDPHSPARHGVLWSHLGWFLARENFATRTHLVRDLARFPELRWLDRYDVAVPALLAISLYFAGDLLARAAPQLGTDGWQLVVWGFCISTVALYHATFLINSAAHGWGSRRYATPDDSRNNLLLALITFGEGWHNNHHRYPGSARQGFFWWEIDLSYYGLRVLERLGLVSNLRPVPASVLEAGRSGRMPAEPGPGNRP